MTLLIWLYLALYPAQKRYHIIPVKDNEGIYHPTYPGMPREPYEDGSYL